MQDKSSPHSVCVRGLRSAKIDRFHFVKNSKLNRMRCPNSTRCGSRLISLHNPFTALSPAIDVGSSSRTPQGPCNKCNTDEPRGRRCKARGSKTLQTPFCNAYFFYLGTCTAEARLPRISWVCTAAVCTGAEDCVASVFGMSTAVFPCLLESTRKTSETT